MSPNPMRCTLVGGAILALAVFSSPVAMASESVDTAADAAPTVLAQASALPTSSLKDTPAVVDEFPAYQRGVRAAAAEGTEALRRYVWRTRMIYNFYYYDFAPKD